MHASALTNCREFIESYAAGVLAGTRQPRVVEVGSQDVNGSLRSVFPPGFEYTGVDFVQGKGVDVVLQDPYALPFETGSVDIVLASSVFEHSEMFWLLFLEILRILKPAGLFYLNVPSNGVFHRYPVDCWRFYPDSGRALVSWARRNGRRPALLESYTSAQNGDIWNDFVAVFVQDENRASEHPSRILHRKSDVTNGILFGSEGFVRPSELPEDRILLHQLAARSAAARPPAPADDRAHAGADHGAVHRALAMLQAAPASVLHFGRDSGTAHALAERFPGCEIVQGDTGGDDTPRASRNRFDLVCLLDVLGRGEDPWTFLRELLARMEPDGQVLVSLWNVSNIALMVDALHGHWPYGAGGPRGRGQLRFFTDYDARRMFYQCGFRVVDHRAHLVGPGVHVFDRHKGETFPIVLAVEDLSVKVQSRDHLLRLCTDQNLYLLSPHHGRLEGDDEMEWAGKAYPPTFAFSG